MKLRRWAAGITVAVLLLPLTACSKGGSSPFPGSSTDTPFTPSTLPQSPHQPTNPTLDSGNKTPANDCSGNLESCRFTKDQMKQYLDAIVPIVWGYYERQHAGLSQPEILYVADDVTGPEQCADARTGRQALYSGTSYEYCPADERVYLGQSTLYALYQIDDVAPAAGLAHELAHHAQKRAGVPGPRTPKQSVVVENQADCVSGDWLAFARQAGQADDDDMADIDKYLAVLGSAESTTRDHGTAAERRAAFARGLQHRIFDCNRYFPGTPLVVKR